jgi:ABC-type sugar transport system substrate-binding protein
MHPRWIPLSLLLTCVSTFVVHAQVEDEAAPSKQAGQHRLRLVFITCCVDQAFFVPVKKGMHDAAKMMDVDCDFIGTKDVDLPEQAKMVSQAVADDYDGIAVNLPQLPKACQSSRSMSTIAPRPTPDSPP